MFSITTEQQFICYHTDNFINIDNFIHTGLNRKRTEQPLSDTKIHIYVPSKQVEQNQVNEIKLS